MIAVVVWGAPRGVMGAEETDEVVLRDIFRFKAEEDLEEGKIKGDWVMDKKKPSFYYKFEKRRVELPNGFFEQ